MREGKLTYPVGWKPILVTAPACPPFGWDEALPLPPNENDGGTILAIGGEQIGI